MTRKLVLLTYDIRNGSDPSAYEDFVRAEDYPAFRKRPSVLEYSGFKVVKNHIGKTAFSRFDLLYIDKFENYEEDVLGDPELRTHSDGWLEKWGVPPKEGDDQYGGGSFNVAFTEEV